ncbi:MAG: hypothetical protein ACLGQW_03045 [Acidobacteriota bacterium]
MANLQELTDELALYRAARDRILSGSQETRIGSQSFRFADLSTIQAHIADLERRISIARAQQSGQRFGHSTAVFRGRR